MSLELLDKTRRMNRLLNEQESDKIDFTDFCRELSRTIEANVVLISRKGKILGLKERKEIIPIEELSNIRYGQYLEDTLKSRFMNILSTKEDVNLLTLGFASKQDSAYRAMVSPVVMAGTRLGTLFIYRCSKEFTIDDIILTEYSATIIGLAMQRAESEELAQEKHKKQDLMAAVKTLSKLELKAVLAVLNEMDGRREATIVASRIADQAGITRSVIVNALRKCESAGIIRTKSAGMKGTTVWLTNDLLEYEFLSKYLTKDDTR